jgi:enterochelin esterase-like enzyme
VARPAPRFESGRFVDLGTFGSASVSDRRVRAYVPRSRSRGSNDPRRPVLVLFDGQNVFEDEGSYAGGWHAHRAVDGLGAKFLAPVIVAIDHGGAERIEELGAPSSPKLAALIDLLVGRVLPAAHERLRLKEGPAAHFIGGSSMGGLAALYTHLRRPDVFGGALCMSPSLWFGGRGVFDFVAKEPNPWRSRVYLDAGAREARGRLVTLVRDMATRLEARGWRLAGDLRVLFRADPKGTHHEAHWRRRLPKALRFLLGP